MILCVESQAYVTGMVVTARQGMFHKLTVKLLSSSTWQILSCSQRSADNWGFGAWSWANACESCRMPHSLLSTRPSLRAATMQTSEAELKYFIHSSRESNPWHWGHASRHCLPHSWVGSFETEHYLWKAKDSNSLEYIIFQLENYSLLSHLKAASSCLSTHTVLWAPALSHTCLSPSTCS